MNVNVKDQPGGASGKKRRTRKKRKRRRMIVFGETVCQISKNVGKTLPNQIRQLKL
jgi:hypothetical protein